MNMEAQSVWKVKGEVYTFLEEDDWLYENQIEEGSIWPEEIRQRICTI